MKSSFLTTSRAFYAAAILLIVACQGSHDQGEPEVGPESLPSGSVSWPGLIPPATKHVDMRLKALEWAPVIDEGVLFLGDSITEGAPLFAMFPNLVTSNHGIGWDTTDGVLLRLGQVTRNSPERLFLMIGTNDTNYTDDPNRISYNIFQIVDALNAALETTEIYVVSTLPREPRGNKILSEVNALLKTNAGGRDYVFLDLASVMRAENGEMKPELSFDNLHLNVHGYAVWEKHLRTCVWQGCPNGL